MPVLKENKYYPSTKEKFEDLFFFSAYEKSKANFNK